MLLYPRSCSAMGLLLTMAGSALPRAVIPATLSALFTVVLVAVDWHHTSIHMLSVLFTNTYPYQVFGNMVGFALVFRTNVAYNRYWEAIGSFKTFTAKWGDAASFVLSFDQHSTKDKEEANGSTRHAYAALVVHRFSLMHALAAAHLRREGRLRQMTEAAATPTANSIVPGSEAEGGAGANATPLTLRSRLALFFNCFHLLHSLKHSSSRYAKYLRDHPMPVLGGISKEEHAFLSRLDSETRVNVLFAQVLGMVNGRRGVGGVAVDAPVLSRVHQELSNGMHGWQQCCKLEDTPFPFPYAQVVSFVLFVFAVTYPVVAASQASGKWTKVPLYDATNLTGDGLDLFDSDSASDGSAELMSAHQMDIHVYWLAPLLTFVTVLTYFAFHEVARELEDPYLHPPNELPIRAWQAQFNSRLLATWEALEEMYSPTMVEMIDYSLKSPTTTSLSQGKAGSGGGEQGGGGGSNGNASHGGGVGGGVGSGDPKTDTALGLHGLRATDASKLLADWKERRGHNGRQASVYVQGYDEDDDLRVEGISSKGGGGVSIPGLCCLDGPKKRKSRSVSHMKNSVHAKKVSAQLVSVS